MKIFDLQGQEYIELNKLLKILQLVNSGGEANLHIENNEVMVNGNTETRKRRKLRSDDTIEFSGVKIKIK